MSRTVEELMYGVEYVSSGEEEPVKAQDKLTLQDWIGKYGDDLCDAWGDLVEYSKESGHLIFDACDFTSFAEAFYETSKKH
jgi:hypothetical protein